MRRLASLTMLLLLALRADATDPPGAPGTCAGDQRRPTIAAITATTRSFKTYSGQVLVSPYGEDLTIYCSGDDSAELEIEHDGRTGSVQLNSSTVSMSVFQPGVGEYTYRCTHRAARCAGALTVTVAPSISLASPEARHSLDDYGTLTYFVPRGEGYDVFCNANDVENLRVEYRSSGIESSGALRTSVSGPAAVGYTVREGGQGGARLYTCTHKALQTVTRHQQIVVIVDNFPEGKDFQCIFKSGLCSWTTLSKMNTFKLFITYSANGDTILICSDNSGEEIRTCSSDKLRVKDVAYLNSEKVLTLQSCNRIVCSNQTFPFD